MRGELAEAPVHFEARRQPLLRVLIASHGHPRIAKGGAEIAAYSLFEQLERLPECMTWFLGCRRDRPESRISQPFSEREFVYSPPPQFDWFIFANRDVRFPAELERLIAELAPDIVHFHHYANFGVEAFHIVKRALPDLRIVLTLHEFLAICAHDGQMVTTRDYHLCHRADPDDCSRCFPERQPSDFYVRKSYLTRFFEAIDHVVAPTRFLKQRYVEWGLPDDKITCIPNVIDDSQGADGEAADDGLFRVGYFGQLSRFKGIEVLIEAARRIDSDDRHNILFEIHGDYRAQSPDIQTAVAEQLASAPRNVRYHGPYDGSRIDRLMRRVDVVAVPSIWWENRPVVIEEALRNRRPVVCSDIGGMAEMVRDGIDGFHFPVGNAPALAALLGKLAAAPERLIAMRPALALPPPPELVTQQHVALYRRLLG